METSMSETPSSPRKSLRIERRLHKLTPVPDKDATPNKTRQTENNIEKSKSLPKKAARSNKTSQSKKKIKKSKSSAKKGDPGENSDQYTKFNIIRNLIKNLKTEIGLVTDEHDDNTPLAEQQSSCASGDQDQAVDLNLRKTIKRKSQISELTDVQANGQDNKRCRGEKDKAFESPRRPYDTTEVHNNLGGSNATTSAETPDVKAQETRKSCGKCFYQCFANQDLELHVKKCHPGSTVAIYPYDSSCVLLCDSCQYRAACDKELKFHQKECHVRARCDKEQLSSHQEECPVISVKLEDDEPFNCPCSGCHYKSTEEFLRNHVSRCHPELSPEPFQYDDTYKFRCQLCRYRALDLYLLNNHFDDCHVRSESDGNSVLQCPHCPYLGRCERDLDVHLNECHSEVRQRSPSPSEDDRRKDSTSTVQSDVVPTVEGNAAFQRAEELSVCVKEEDLTSTVQSDVVSTVEGNTAFQRAEEMSVCVKEEDDSTARTDASEFSFFFLTSEVSVKCEPTEVSTQDQTPTDKDHEENLDLSVVQGTSADPRDKDTIRLFVTSDHSYCKTRKPRKSSRILRKNVRMYLCTKCHFKSSRLILLMAHLKRSHLTSSSAFVYSDAYRFHCNLCKFRALTAHEISNHMAVCHSDFPRNDYCRTPGSKSRRSQSCTRKMQSVFTLNDNVQLVPTPTFQYQCAKCHYAAHDPAGLERHNDSCHLVDSKSPFWYTSEHKFCCHLCDFRSLRVTILVNHLNMCHGGVVPTKNNYSTPLPQSNNLSESKTQNCTKCHYKTTTQAALSNHVSQCHKKKCLDSACNGKLHCHLCQFHSGTLSGMSRHLRVCHLDFTQYHYCVVCRFRTKDSRELNSHLASGVHEVAVPEQFELSTVQTMLDSLNIDSDFAKVWCDPYEPPVPSPENVVIDPQPACAKCQFRAPAESLADHLCYDDTYQFLCHLCLFLSRDRDVLSSHIAECHPGETDKNSAQVTLSDSSDPPDLTPVITSSDDRKCQKCQYKTSSSESLADHLSRCHPDDATPSYPYDDTYQFLCHLCHYRSQEPDILSSHLAVCHSDFGDEMTGKNCLYPQHSETHSVTEDYIQNVRQSGKCRKCQFKASANVSLVRHLSHCHPDDVTSSYHYDETYQFFCHVCHYRSKDPDSLLSHLKECHSDVEEKNVENNNWILDKRSFTIVDTPDLNPVVEIPLQDQTLSKELPDTNGTSQLSRDDDNADLVKTRSSTSLKLFSCSKCQFKAYSSLEIWEHAKRCHIKNVALGFPYDDTHKVYCHLCKYRSLNTADMSDHQQDCHSDLTHYTTMTDQGLIKSHLFTCKKDGHEDSNVPNERPDLSKGPESGSDSQLFKLPLSSSSEVQPLTNEIDPSQSDDDSFEPAQTLSPPDLSEDLLKSPESSSDAQVFKLPLSSSIALQSVANEIDTSQGDHDSVKPAQTLSTMSPYNCQKCQFKAKSSMDHCRHLRRCHVSAGFIYDVSYKFCCHRCKYRALNTADLSQHLQACHLDSTQYCYCQFCGLMLTDESLKDSHLATCEKSDGRQPQAVVELQKTDLTSDVPNEPPDKLSRKRSVSSNELELIIDENGWLCSSVVSSKFKRARNRTMIFSCSDCHFKGPTSESLWQHLRRCHLKKSPFDFVYHDSHKFHCHLCEYRDLNTADLSEHLQVCHLDSTQYHYCQTCGLMIRDESLMEAHRATCRKAVLNTAIEKSSLNKIRCNANQSARPAIVYNCSHCMFKSTSNNKLVTHLSRCHPNDLTPAFKYGDEDRYFCHLCKFRARGPVRLKTHLEVCHLVSHANYYCRKCFYNSSSFDGLQKHLSGHSNGQTKQIDMISCALCEYGTDKKSILSEHMRHYHSLVSTDSCGSKEPRPCHSGLNVVVTETTCEQSDASLNSTDVRTSVESVKKPKPSTIGSKGPRQCHSDLDANSLVVTETTWQENDASLKSSDVRTNIESVKDPKPSTIIIEDQCVGNQSETSVNNSNCSKRPPKDSSSTFKNGKLRNYRCHLCQFQTSRIKQIKAHLKGCQADARHNYYCTKCFYTASSPELLQIHLSLNSECRILETLSCTLCRYATDEEKNLTDHMNNYHAMPRYGSKESGQCQESDASVKSGSDTHKNIDKPSVSITPELGEDQTETCATPTTLFNCSMCRFKAKSNFTLRFHLSRCHPTSDPSSAYTYSKDDNYYCHLCKFRTGHIDRIEGHLKVCHLDLQKYHYCTMCFYSSSSLDNLEKHLSVHSVTGGHTRQNGPTSCQLCQYETDTTSNLLEHMQHYHLNTGLAENVDTNDSSPNIKLPGDEIPQDISLTSTHNISEIRSDDPATTLLCSNSDSQVNELQPEYSDRLVSDGVISECQLPKSLSKTISCSKCHFKAAKSEEVLQHARRCHIKNSSLGFADRQTHKFRCHLCEYRALNTGDISEHLQVCHMDLTQYHYCQDCGAITREAETHNCQKVEDSLVISDESLKETDTCQGGDASYTNYHCSKCLYKSSKLTRLRYHLEHCHPEDSSRPSKYDESHAFRCPLCQFRSKLLVPMESHFKNCHLDLQKYQHKYPCELCQYETDDKKTLLEHMRHCHFVPDYGLTEVESSLIQSHSQDTTNVTENVDTNDSSCTEGELPSNVDLTSTYDIKPDDPADLTPTLSGENAEASNTQVTYDINEVKSDDPSNSTPTLSGENAESSNTQVTYDVNEVKSDDPSNSTPTLSGENAESSNTQVPYDVNETDDPTNLTPTLSGENAKSSNTQVTYDINKVKSDDPSNSTPTLSGENTEMTLDINKSDDSLNSTPTLSDQNAESSVTQVTNDINEVKCDARPNSTATLLCATSDAVSECNDISATGDVKTSECQLRRSLRVLSCSKCQFRAKTSQELVQHRRLCHLRSTCRQNYKFRCHLCEYRTPNTADMTEHLQVCHLDFMQYYYCQTCGATMTDETLVQTHICKINSGYVIELKKTGKTCNCCTLCYFKTDNTTTMQRHIKNCHTIDPDADITDSMYKYHCRWCRYRTKVYDPMYKHKRMCHTKSFKSTAEINYNCTLCLFKGTDTTSLLVHLKRCHPIPSSSIFQYDKSYNMYCHLCQFRAQNPVQMGEHLTSCHEIFEQYFYCRKCPYNSVNEDSIIKHAAQCGRSSKNKGRIVFCLLCNYEAGSERLLSDHIRRRHSKITTNRNTSVVKSQKTGLTSVKASGVSSDSKIPLPHSNRLTASNESSTSVTEEPGECHVSSDDDSSDNFECVQIRPATANPEFSCSKCEFRATTSSGVWEHAKRCHVKSYAMDFNDHDHKFHCHMCEYRSSSTDDLSEHLELCHSDSTQYYSCQTCGLVTRDETLSKTHEATCQIMEPQSNKTPNGHLCTKCYFTTASKVDLQSHRDTCHRVRSVVDKKYEFHCYLCRFQAVSHNGMSTHLRICHTVESDEEKHMRLCTRPLVQKCSKCLYESRFKQRLLTHMSCCHPGGEVEAFKYGSSHKFTCEFCTFRARAHCDLGKHLEACHSISETYYCCKKCRFRSTSRVTIRKHSSTHDADKPEEIGDTVKSVKCSNTVELACKRCDFKTGLKAEMTVHTSRCHPGDSSTPYKYYRKRDIFYCHLCQFRDAKRASMVKHLMECHQISARYYYCKECPFSCKLKSVFNQHEAKCRNATVTLERIRTTSDTSELSKERNQQEPTNELSEKMMEEQVTSNITDLSKEVNEQQATSDTTQLSKGVMEQQVTGHITKISREESEQQPIRELSEGVVEQQVISNNSEFSNEENQQQPTNELPSQGVKEQQASDTIELSKQVKDQAISDTSKLSKEENKQEVTSDNSELYEELSKQQASSELSKDLKEQEATRATSELNKEVKEQQQSIEVSTSGDALKEQPFTSYSSELSKDLTDQQATSDTSELFKEVNEQQAASELSKEVREQETTSDTVELTKAVKEQQATSDTTELFKEVNAQQITSDTSELSKEVREEQQSIAVNPSDEALKCTKCQYQTKHNANIKFHIDRCHPEDSSSPFMYSDTFRIGCTLCQFRAKNQLQVDVHLKMCHFDSIIDNCTTYLYSYYNQEPSSIKVGKYPCSRCHYYDNQKGLQAHISRCHPYDSLRPFRYTAEYKHYCYLCQYRAKSAQILARHLSTCHLTSTNFYCCTKCSFSSEDEAVFAAHVTTTSCDPESHQCSQCHFKAEEELLVERHTSECHPGSTLRSTYASDCKYYCHYCQYRVPTRPAIVEHLTTCHLDSTTYHYCLKCPFSTSDEAILAEHKATCASESDVTFRQVKDLPADNGTFQICPSTDCRYMTCSDQSLKDHLSRCHPSLSESPFPYDATYRFSCQMCQYRGRSEQLLTDHRNTCHVGQSVTVTKFICSWCLFYTFDYHKLTEHTVEFHGRDARSVDASGSYIKIGSLHLASTGKGGNDTYFKCRRCSYESVCELSLIDHSNRCHPSGDPYRYDYSYMFPCNFCYYKTADREVIARHLRMCHLDSTSYCYCSECPSVFRDESQLSLHMSSRHFLKDLSDECVAPVLSESTPVSSERTSDSSDPKIYRCTRCEYKVNCELSLEDHKDQCHPKGPPIQYSATYKYYCHLCQYRTRQRDVIARHLTLCHLDFNSYFYCTQCPFISPDMSGLQDHLSACHPPSDLTTYRCTLCQFKVNDASTLGSHKDRCHPHDSTSPFQYDDTYKFFCHLCQFRSVNQSDIPGHLSACHLDSNTYYYCTRCSFISSDESGLVDHTSMFHCSSTASTSGNNVIIIEDIRLGSANESGSVSQTSSGDFVTVLSSGDDTNPIVSAPNDTEYDSARYKCTRPGCTCVQPLIFHVLNSQQPKCT